MLFRSTLEVVDGIDPRMIGVFAYKAELDPALVPGAEVAAGSGH